MSAITQVTGTTVTVLVPLQVRRRNGRPRIVLPHSEDGRDRDSSGDQASAAVLRAIARAWGWRCRLEAGEAATLQDIADHEKVTLPFVSRFIRLAYLSPAVLQQVVTMREGVALPLDRLAAAVLEPWAEQEALVFGASDPAQGLARSRISW